MAGISAFLLLTTMLQFSELSMMSRHEIRLLIRNRRRVLSKKKQTEFARLAAERAINFLPVVMAKKVGLFLSFDGELDTQPLVELLWCLGKSVYCPILHPFSPGNLLFSCYHASNKLVLNRLKIREPLLDVRDVLPVRQLDVLITPLVAFDEMGYRLGMGGGFYDRTLQNYRKYGLSVLGYAHDCQAVKAFPREQWDVPLPAVVTPSHLLIW